MALRRLYQIPVVLNAERRLDYNEKAAAWWELFVDLVMVIAATNCADNFKEAIIDGKFIDGLLSFLLIFTIFQDGWHLYSHFATRFEDESLFHSLHVYLYITSTASMVAHYSDQWKYIKLFCYSVAIQRFVLCMMYFWIYIFHESSRVYSIFYMLLFIITTALFIFTGIYATSTENENFPPLVIWLPFLINIIISNTSHFWFQLFIKNARDHYIPLHIDHLVDRHGCLVLVVLGEGLLSAVSNFNNLESTHRHGLYYIVMMLQFLTIYSLALFYFHIVPERSMHAYRRSTRHGIGYQYSFKVFTTALLSYCVSVKFVTRAVISKNKMSTTEIWLLFGSLSISVMSLFIIRLLHYWGRHPTENDPPELKRLKYQWWFAIGAGSLVPLIIGIILTTLFNTTTTPLIASLLAAISIFGLVLIESTYTHTIHNNYGVLSSHVQLQDSLIDKQ